MPGSTPLSPALPGHQRPPAHSPLAPIKRAVKKEWNPRTLRWMSLITAWRNVCSPFSLLGVWTRMGWELEWEDLWLKSLEYADWNKAYGVFFFLFVLFLLQDSFNMLVSLNFLEGGCRMQLPRLFCFYPGTLPISQNKSSQQLKGTSPMWWEPCEWSQVNRAFLTNLNRTEHNKIFLSVRKL